MLRIVSFTDWEAAVADFGRLLEDVWMLFIEVIDHHASLFLSRDRLVGRIHI